MKEQIKYWLDTAQYDLDTAEAMLQTKRYLYVGFMCHQVAEKSLKAIIASKDIFPPKIHNLLALAKQADLLNDLSEKQINFLSTLNPLNIESRYPSYIEKIQELTTVNISQELLSETREWFQWIKSRL